MWGRAGSNSECWLDAAQKPSLWLVCSESLVRVSARRKFRALPTGHRQTEGVLSMMRTDAHTHIHACVDGVRHLECAFPAEEGRRGASRKWCSREGSDRGPGETFSAQPRTKLYHFPRFIHRETEAALGRSILLKIN